MSLAFHACPPPGTWMNDPNGLVPTATGWRLLAQYRDDRPDFALTHWGSWTSDNLVDWRFEGTAIAAAPDGFAYSGGVVAVPGGLDAFHTLHDPLTRAERQVWRTSSDQGRTWSLPAPILGPARSNRRDPFVWKPPRSHWRALVARPGDWDATTQSSHLEIWSSPDRRAWAPRGRVQPLSPPGVLWEVPVALEDGTGRVVLVISTIDRRHGRADCAVRAWQGRFRGEHFERDGARDEGELLDLGPDFYAAIPFAHGPRATPGQAMVAWLGSWQTARRMPWPGFHGGPMTLPRRLVVDAAGAMTQRPLIDGAMFEAASRSVPVAGRGTAAIDGDFIFTLASAEAQLTMAVRQGTLDARREGADWLGWRAQEAWPAAAETLEIFVDGPAVEIFRGSGRTPLTVALPTGDTAFSARIDTSRGPVPIAWKTRPVARRAATA